MQLADTRRVLDAAGEEVSSASTRDRESLADGLAMSVAVGGAAVVGMASWLYVAHTVSAAEVGRVGSGPVFGPAGDHPLSRGLKDLA